MMDFPYPTSREKKKNRLKVKNLEWIEIDTGKIQNKNQLSHHKQANNNS